MPSPYRAVIAFVIAGLLLVAGCSAPEPRIPTPDPEPRAASGLTADDVDAWLDGLVPAALERSGIAGATVSVVRDGRILSARGYGRAETGTAEEPARRVDAEQTLFRAASISKVFAATAALQLVEQGRLRLDEPIDRHLDFALPQPKGAVTLRHLLTHSAGFEERARPGIEPPGTTLDLRAFVADQPPEQVFVPGTVPAYSNYGYSLVGYLVERASGTAFADYVQRHVFDRARMDSSTFLQPLPETLAARLAAGYPDESQPAKPFEMVAASPAGALSTTATDMGRFMLALLGDSTSGRPLLRPATLSLMQRPGLATDSLGTLAQGPQMTLGLFPENRNGRVILGHDGDTTVYHSAFEIYPAESTGVFVSMNGTGRAPTDAYELREAVLNGFADRYFPGAASPAGPLPDAAAAAAKVAGTYETSRTFRSTFLAALGLTGQVKVTAEPGGTLRIEPGPGSFRPGRYEQIGPMTWREVGGQRVVAVRESGGRVDAIGAGAAFTLLRADPARQGGVAGVVAAVSLGVLIVSMLAWPALGLVRRFYRIPPRSLPVPRLVRALRRIGIAATLIAAMGWVLVLGAVQSYTTVPDVVLRLIQVA